MLVHTLFDLIAWISAAAFGWWVRRHYLREIPSPINYSEHPTYFTALGLGALLGAVILGSLNLGPFELASAGQIRLGHSSAGAIAGGIVGVEFYKKCKGIRASTGLVFVAPLASGIAVGRWGCFFAGLDDFTYGTETVLPWGWDFGDGVNRHPVQLYESFAMLIFLVMFIQRLGYKSSLFCRHGFYLFIVFYSIQRFLWEFIKPYQTLMGRLNIFHLVCVALLTYALFMIKVSEKSHA